MNRAKEIRYFFYSQQFSDGLRITASILLPAMVALYLGYFQVGITISLGAVCVSITDAPGPFANRRKGMWLCLLFVLIVAVTTVLVRGDPWLLGLEILFYSFIFSLFNVYGNRAAGVGSAAILIMILTMAPDRDPLPLATHIASIFCGGIWYMSLSWVFYRIRPYRAAQRILGDCLREIAAYLFIKGKFYDVKTGLEEDYNNMVDQQVVVHEKQDAVRDLFFKTRRIVAEKDAESRRLVGAFVLAVDLFEDITATYYDYRSIRQRFGQAGILLHISMLIKKLAGELDLMGIAIQSNTSFQLHLNFEEELKILKGKIDALQATEESNLILKKILVNVRRIMQRISYLQLYFDKSAEMGRTNVDHTLFVSRQSLDPRILWSNLSFDSAVFRHALRVAIACIAGYAVSRWLSYGEYSYWILLTIAFILKPAFGLTRQRNIDRLIGTLAGGLIGVLILVLVENTTVQFVCMVVLMVGAYSVLRTNYIAMVIYITAYILILFRFLGIPFLSVAQERILDTVIGCAIAFSTGYFLFPVWEAKQLPNFMAEVLKANAAYLQKFIDSLQTQRLNLVDYKLARKNVYVHAANLAAAFRRMTSEPRNKQYNRTQVQLFVIQNHLLLSNIANLVAAARAQRTLHNREELMAEAGLCVQVLQQTAAAVENEGVKKIEEQNEKQAAQPMSLEDLLLKKQLDFIQHLCRDIQRTAETILAA